MSLETRPKFQSIADWARPDQGMCFHFFFDFELHVTFYICFTIIFESVLLMKVMTFYNQYFPVLTGGITSGHGWVIEMKSLAWSAI